jgi:hypothetical protein
VLAFFSFSDMVFGFQPLSKVWTNFWHIIPPENPQLAAALYITLAVAAPTKGAVYCRRNPALRKALAAANTVNAGLFSIFPLRQITQDLGANCATSSILIVFVPLFVGWVLYVIVDARRSLSLAESRTP